MVPSPVALPVALLLIPAALLLLGGKKRGGGVPAGPYGFSWESRDAEDLAGQEEQGLPLSDRMLLNAACDGPAALAIKWRYDMRITAYYWYLRAKLELNDPEVLAAEILYLDSPHCQWPPPPGAPEWQQIIWDGTYSAVMTYYTLDKAGKLPNFFNEPSRVKPLVVWAT